MKVLLLGLLGLYGCSESAKNPSLDATHNDSAEPGGQSSPADSGLTSFEVTGTVTDQDGTAVVDAMVLVGGQPDTTVLTDSAGQYSLWFTDIGMGKPAIVAAKQGYRSTGREFFSPDTALDLRLKIVGPEDNEDYIYQDPGDGFDETREDCSHCHTDFVMDLLNSKHAEAASNPKLHDLYAGISQAYTSEEDCLDAGGLWAIGLEPGTESTAVSKCYLGGGVLPDLNNECGDSTQPSCDDPSSPEAHWPEHFGGCADCHAPGIDGVAGARDLLDAHGLAYDKGIHCDVCHKVRDVDMSQPPGIGTRLVLGRPSTPGENTFEWDPVYFGPLVDVPNVAMGGSVQPKFDQAVFCAGCHQQAQDALMPGESLDATLWPDGLPIHTTYEEWEDGPFNQEETPCQFCHMPGDTEATNSVDISTPQDQSITFGFPRDPSDIRRHTFRGPLEGKERLIDTALYMSIAVTRTGSTIDATVSVANIGCGHAVPTGEPMRALVLLVEGHGECGDLIPSGGLTVPDTGGTLATGNVGTDLSVSGDTITWVAGSALAEPGHVLRAVHPSGEYEDYAGIGVFSDPDMTPEDKGMEISHPLGHATIVSVDGDTLMLDGPLDVEAGDVVFLGEAWPEDARDGDPARHLAGLPGTTFSKVLLDSAGNRHVPHYKAVDIASDNRIAPGTNVLTHHTFEIPAGCTEGQIQATMIYRPIPLHLARLRGWESSDAIISIASTDWD